MVRIRRNKTADDVVYLTAEEGPKIVGSAVGGLMAIWTIFKLTKITEEKV